MRRVAYWTLVVALWTGGAWGAPPKTRPTAPQAAAAAQAVSAYEASMKDLERNATLGEALTKRDGSADELALVQKLAERGMGAARGLVEKDPKSARAHYLLGSWLLYGYRVTELEQINVDEQGETHRHTVKGVAEGINESPTEGLEELLTAHTLDRKSVAYLVDYASALLDWGQPNEAMNALRPVWASDMDLTSSERLRVALLMSDIQTERGDVTQARSWLYRALSEQPQNVPIVQRLQELDRLQAEVTKQEIEAPTPPAEEETAPSGEEATPEEQVAPEPSAPADEEAAPAPGNADEAAPAPDTSSGEEAAPPADQGTSADQGSAASDEGSTASDQGAASSDQGSASSDQGAGNSDQDTSGSAGQTEEPGAEVGD